jgi:hypothetical protein
MYAKKLLGITIPEQVTQIGEDAFYKSNLIEIALPESVSIGAYAFGGSRLQSVYFAGSEEAWAAIAAQEGSEQLSGAEIHCNSAAPAHIAHTAKVVQENVRPVTCTEKGSYDEVMYCADCGREMFREEKTQSALGHKFTGPVVQNEDGTYSYTCIHCGKPGDPMNKLPGGYCQYCLQQHTGVFADLVSFVHRILYFFQNLFGNK